jgi:hypothetical protein
VTSGDFDSDVEERCWHAREAISYGNLAEAEATLNQLAPVNLFDIREWIDVAVTLGPDGVA